jgi:threonylcarbamoyladenosine tRNA methylthiotransferase MtaB
VADAAARGVLVAFRTLGCKVNRVESEAIAAELLGRGAEVVDEERAAVVIINTCTVTGEADAKARKAVRHALRAPHEPIVVVTGCLAALDRAGLESLGERVVVEADKERVALRVGELLALAENQPHHLARRGKEFRTRAILKIQDGCDAYCAYCIVPYARGVPRAVPLPDVVAEACELVSAGATEIVLTGINIGRYQHEGTRLPGLLEAVAASGVARLRLSSIEPLDITDELLEAIRRTPSFCPHLHVPLQSGSDVVLGEMGRKYSVDEYRECIARARAIIPGLAVSTDVIAGFPGETDGQAADTLRFCDEMRFSKMHVFRYSRREGTPAAGRSDQVPPEVRSARASALRECGRAGADCFARARLGDTVEVLVESAGEGIDGPSLAEGMTPDYLRVFFPSDHVRAGELATVVLERREGERLMGALLA